MWNKAVTPRSRFVVWLACQERLKTKQRLKNMEVMNDETCPICGTQTESIVHLFFQCDFSYQCVEALKRWVGVNWSIKSMKEIHRKRRMPKLIEAIFCNLIYAIWNARNDVIWQKKVMTVWRVVDSIKDESKIRFNSLSLNEPFSHWLTTL